MERDQNSNMRVVFLFEDAVFIADGNSASIDMSETDVTVADAGNLAESLTYVVSIGTIATVGGSIDCRCEESDDNSVWVNVENAEVIGGTDLANETQTSGDAVSGLSIPIGAQTTAYRLGSIGKKRYQRLALTQETNVTAGQVSVTGILLDHRHDPQVDQNS